MASENDTLPGGKVGGIGDVYRDIPPASGDLEHQVNVINPGYGLRILERLLCQHPSGSPRELLYMVRTLLLVVKSMVIGSVSRQKEKVLGAIAFWSGTAEE